MLNKLLNLYNTRKTTLAFAAGAVLGLVVGLLFAWVIWPTSYYNATPAMLRQDFRDDYLAWVAREYAQNRDLQQAQTRLGLAYWKKEPVAVLEDLAQRRGGADGQNLQALAQALKERRLPHHLDPLPCSGPVPSFRFVASGCWRLRWPRSCTSLFPASAAPEPALSPSGLPPTVRWSRPAGKKSPSGAPVQHHLRPGR